MKSFITSFIGFLLIIAAPLSFAGGAGWKTDLAAAKVQAKAEGKGILIEFTGSDWCPPCIMMRKKVFSKSEFTSQAAKKYVLVELDFPRSNPNLTKKNEHFAEMYNVQAFPTVILLNSSGKEKSRFIASKYPSVEKFLKKIGV